MPTPRLTEQDARAIVEATNAALKDGYRLYGNPSATGEAAKRLGISRSTAHNRILRAKELYSIAPDPSLERSPDEPDVTGAPAESRVRVENTALRQRVRDLEQKLATSEALGALIEDAAAVNIHPPKWLAPKIGRRKERAIACSILSDLHLDEVVRPEEINWVNAYDREIAEGRLERYFGNLIRLCRDYINGIQLDGLVVALGGDMLSGNIHEELKETNAAPVLDSVLFWSERLAAGLRMLLDLGVPIYCPAVVGNHGRLSRKPRAKFRAKENFDWILYHIIAREFRSEKQIQFDIPDAADHRFKIFDTRYQLTHGDQFRGGSGIAGMLSPLMLGDHRKRKREMATGQPYDYLVMGHWHQLAHVKGLVVNGSLKGYDEYSTINNFEFEPPQQAFWLTDPVWGKTIDAPVHTLGNDEYWRKMRSVA